MMLKMLMIKLKHIQSKIYICLVLLEEVTDACSLWELLGFSMIFVKLRVKYVSVIVPL